MRPVLALLLCALAAACRTSSLGSCTADADCSSNAMCDAVQRVCIPTDAPQIANVSVTTAPAYAAPDGKLFFETAGPPLAVSATVTSRGGAAVDPASVCLRVTGESGACAHPGTAGAGNTFTFTLPRAAGPADGTVVAFAVSATAASGHSAVSATQQVYFDDQPPSISVVDDPAAYARTLPDGGAAPINVSATIADSSGVVNPHLISGAKSVPPSSSNANVYVFPLDPADAPAGVEGAYGFLIAASDNLGHTTQAGGSRKIDDAPPAISSLQIYKDVPDGGGVTYPAFVADTGWTGATFVYSDTVHVSGTLTDLSGIGSAALRVDGIGIDGGVSTGTSRSLNCTPGTTSCPFSLDVTLNDAGSAFHTGSSTFDAGVAVGFIPAGNLQFVIDVQDRAAAFDGTPSPKSSSGTTAARTTRLLWDTTLAGAAVSGLAVHPNGDVIATVDGGTSDVVYDLAPDQPLTRWSFGIFTTTPLPGVTGTPAIGAGDASTARIYVAGSTGGLYAVNPNGGEAWETDTGVTLFVGPAVAQVTAGDQIIVPDGIGSPNSKVWGATSTALTSAATSNRDFIGAPLILGNEVFFGTQSAGGGTTRLTKHSIAGGVLGAAATDATTGTAPYLGLVTDGTDLYATTTTGGILFKIDTAFTRPAIWSSTLSSPLAGEPTFGIDGLLYGADLLNRLSTFTPGNATRTTFVTLGSVGMTPLHGSDGHVYVPRRTGLFDAYEGNQLSWTFDPPGAILRYATMDCQGRVFVASGATVYAFLSDDRGLADTPWPSLRRDARNTGNAGAPKYGMRTASGCTQ